MYELEDRYFYSYEIVDLIKLAKEMKLDGEPHQIAIKFIAEALERGLIRRKKDVK